MKIDHTKRDELDRRFAYELDRELAMTLAGVGRRALALWLIATIAAAAGVYTTLLRAARLLHG